jgi:hypothetical protein
VVLVIACLGIAHFVVGLFLTLRLMFSSDSPGTYVWFSLPYIAITGIFVASVVCGHIRRFRWSAVTLVLGLFVSVAPCLYDLQNHRYQANGGGTGAQYFIWWWYYEPFWHGYEPGNV